MTTQDKNKLIKIIILEENIINEYKKNVKIAHSPIIKKHLDLLIVKHIKCYNELIKQIKNKSTNI